MLLPPTLIYWRQYLSRGNFKDYATLSFWIECTDARQYSVAQKPLTYRLAKPNVSHGLSARWYRAVERMPPV
jgi:hypothetical protein